METLIEKYNNLQKQILSEVGLKWKVDEGNPLSREELQDYYYLGKYVNLDILHNSIYLIDVGELVKKNFLKFGLEAPSRQAEVGGRYLRLYGLLSAVYQQKLAVENLLELYKMEEKEKISSGLNSSSLINLCNKLGAHATHFRSNLAGFKNQFRFYEFSRQDLENNKIKLLVKKYEFENYDLLEDLKHFNKKVELTLSFMISQILKNSFNNQGEYYKQYLGIEKQKDSIST
ncbi:hypothetical protein [Rufibacter latericius]|uniref:Cthe-2314-like HEPN domain-containing protein n=1 Tax=Rufibacter latericius TaxID=2487040 RepID=A0A3M9MUV7_9BACT|nr:hypothetical protein [Rufibacter latericius]RNI28975.1 hypothetical protein EFB08_05945 [Rufibacter latericius]